MASRRKIHDQQAGAGKITDFRGAILQIAEEKGIPRDKVIDTIAAALAAAYKKDYGKKSQVIRAEFDDISGDARFYLVKEVVDETTRIFEEEKEKGEDEKENEKKTNKRKENREGKAETEILEDENRLLRYNPERDLTVEEARKIKKDAKVGDIIETELEQKKDYGRVAAQTAKQVILQRIREAERDAMYDEYKNREGEVVSGIVQRVEGNNVIVDLGRAAGVIFPSEQVDRESYRIGQRVKVYIIKVEAGSKGPGITLSRVHPEMIRKLFELEVPEIFSGTVEIKAIAREAGERTKIAVASSEDGVDPIGSCVGQKGTRVQAVIEELSGEKIDIVLWNDDTSKFISAALSPSKVIRVDINEENKEARVMVPEDQLSLAIGKRGQNVRLAAKLTGWKIDIVGMKTDGEEIKKGEGVTAAKEEKEEKKEIENSTEAGEDKKNKEDESSGDENKKKDKKPEKKEKESSKEISENEGEKEAEASAEEKKDKKSEKKKKKVPKEKTESEEKV